jgi:phosphatidylglycerophosphate synthase
MFGDKFGHILDAPLSVIARKIPFSPNSITIAGFALTLISSPILAVNLQIGALCMLPACFLDVLDGIVARVRQKESSYGAFLDSVLDRYSDAFILLAIAWNLAQRGQLSGVLLSLVSLIGAFIISYTRARAEGLGIGCTHGLMERPERLLLLFAGAVSGFIMPALWILAVLTHITVLQRILYSRKQLNRNN